MDMEIEGALTSPRRVTGHNIMSRGAWRVGCLVYCRVGWHAGMGTSILCLEPGAEGWQERRVQSRLC